MYKFLFFFLGIFFINAQQTSTDSLRLSDIEIERIFSSDIKKQHHITFNIYKAYGYEDTKGKHLILMTENPTKKKGSSFRKQDLKFRDSIKAYFFDIEKEQLTLKRTLTDFIIQREYLPEYSIRFWNKFFELDDFDGNGTIEPILIYGTYGMNGASDGRIKIIVLQNDKKIAIRHQNGILDGERFTQVNAEFYNLPKEIQQQVITQMEAITADKKGIFPYGWQHGMQQEKLKLSD